MMSAAAKTPYPVTHQSLVKYQSANGATTLPSIEPTDEKVVPSAPRSQPATAAIPAGHESAKIAPNDVATPFPPLNESHGEKQWPSTAAAATIAARRRSCSVAITSAGGKMPFAASSKSTATAPRLPNARRAFIAPMFPLPDA